MKIYSVSFVVQGEFITNRKNIIELIAMQFVKIKCLTLQTKAVLEIWCSQKLSKIHRKTPAPESFFNKVAGLDSLAQVFSCEFCEISKSAFFTEHHWTTASDQNCKWQFLASTKWTFTYSGATIRNTRIRFETCSKSTKKIPK